MAVLAGPGLFEFTTDYRVAGFSGTHVSGGQIGTYIAMAFLFLLIFLERPRHLTIIAMSGIAGVLVVSHSRTAYVAAFLSALTAALAWAWAAHHRHPGTAHSSPIGLAAFADGRRHRGHCCQRWLYGSGR